MSTPMTFEQRITAFWSNVDKNGPVPPLHPEMSNCWIWTAYKCPEGYGRFMIPAGGKQKCAKAHRLSLFLLNGAWTKHRDVDHLCHVPACVRPDHLRDVPHKVNMENRIQKLCHRGHPLAEPNFYHYGGGRRRCLACMRLRRTS